MTNDVKVVAPANNVTTTTDTTGANEVVDKKPAPFWKKCFPEKPKTKEDESPRVPYLRLFEFATTFDKVLMLIGSIAAATLGAALPVMTVILGDVLDSYVTYTPLIPGAKESFESDVRTAVISFVIIGFVAGFCGYLQMSLWMWSGENIAKKIREKYFLAVLRQDIGWFDSSSAGQLTTRMASDTALIQEGISEKIGNIIQFSCTFVAGFITAFSIAPRLTAVLICVFPLLGAAGGLLSKSIANRSTRGQGAYAEAGGIADAVFSSMRTVVSFGGEKKEVKRYDDKLDIAYQAGYKKAVALGLGIGSIMFLIFSCYALAFFYGSRLIPEISPGDIITSFFAIIFSAFSLGNAAPFFGAIGSAQGAAVKIYETIDRASPIDPLDPKGEKLKTVKGDVEFANIDFHYPTRSDVPVLKNFSLKVASGSTVALVGQSGSGKSTIVKLLERFYDPINGKVLLDGHDVKELNLQWLREQIGIVSQEPNLFDTTIRRNILYGLSFSTEQELEKEYGKEKLEEMVIKACESANCWKFISSLPKGLDTIVGEAAALLSGGQRQRIAIARAVIRSPSILLLDEATSSLDSEMERLVQAALDKASEGRTTIVIAHRLSTIKNANCIVVMKQGEIVEMGTHNELLAAKGTYAGLVERQTLRTLEEQNKSKGTGSSSTNLTSSVHEAASAVESEKVKEIAVKGEETPMQVIVDPKKPVLKKAPKYDITNEELVKELDPEGLLPKAELEDLIKKRREEDMLKRNLDWRRVFRINAPEWYLILVGVIAAGINGATNPVFAIIFGEILTVLGNPNLEEMRADAAFWSGMFMILAGGGFIVNFLQIFCFTTSGERMSRRIRSNLFRHLIYQNIAFFDEEENSSGAITSKLAEDATQIQGLTGQLLGSILQSISGLVTGLVIAFVNSWALTLVVFATLPLIMGSGFIVIRSLSGFGAKIKKEYTKTAQMANEAIQNIRTVSTLTKEAYFYQKYVNGNSVPHQIAVKGAFVSSLGFAASQAIIYLCYALAFWFGSTLILDGKNSNTEVLTALFAVIFTAMQTGQSLAFAPNVAKAKVGALSVFDLMDRVSEIDASSTDGAKPETVIGEVTVSNVEFKYPSRPDIPILKGLNLEVKKSQTIGLVGASGCGKSTVIQLCERFYDIDGGKFKVDDNESKSWNVDYLRRQMALVGQEPVLFDMSIAENIAYGMEEHRIISQDEIEAAARDANIHEFIVSLPDGYKTRVGERGLGLSGGQKQRVAIARALIRAPKLLLLDEATSALDAESEKIVQEAIDKVSKGRTTIVIAHRLSTIQDADQIYVFRDGVVAERGTHFELIAKGGLYKNLVESQELGATS